MSDSGKNSDSANNTLSVPERLLLAAKQFFLSDEYHQVSTRRIAEAAQVNTAMIRYYFGNKEGLYEEMIRAALTPILDALDSDALTTRQGYIDYLRTYYRTMSATPELPKLMFKVVALSQGPGRRFVQQLLERGQKRGARRLDEMQQSGQLQAGLDPDLLRLAFTSLAMMPMLLKENFEAQMERPMDEAFLDRLADFNGQMFAQALASAAAQGREEQAP
ncbi:TetR/AcrR family transcriptional regulator [Roseateles oligotrophus]|uniref:TetR/AcrR family transcriptional regulator n=1 Tax=Roseateles oligotrophus TaxID=1769250 RepID=A0ABT2YLK4_9BURK|nr:TetR/AcrR family transcriptional regulator [Roseateles oligotrophus]MCV2370952.1 TetR/AcrR family transcriptional regulator [Roseateles oligotrophus]